MDFMMGLPTTQRKNNPVWVIVDQMTKSAHFLPIKSDFSLSKLGRLYINNIVRLHRVPSSIVFDGELWEQN